MVAPRALGALAFAGGLAFHPLHTTLTELSYRPADHVVEVRVRAFADDFRAAAGRYVRSGGPAARGVADSALSGYLASTLMLEARDGMPVVLSWCGVQQTGDLLWLCLRGRVPRGLAGARVRATQLFDLYGDQINIVQVSYDGRTASLLFTRGDGAKPLP